MERRSWWGLPLAAASMGALLVAGCGGAPPATPEQVTQESRRLLAPFLVRQDVACDELTITLSANFVPCVSQPAVDTLRHRARKVPAAPGAEWEETEWLNLSGSPDSAFVVTVTENSLDQQIATGRPGAVQALTFTVLRAFRLRVYTGRRPMALAAEANGNVFTLQNGQTRDLAGFRIADGVVVAH